MKAAFKDRDSIRTVKSAIPTKDNRPKLKAPMINLILSTNESLLPLYLWFASMQDQAYTNLEFHYHL